MTSLFHDGGGANRHFAVDLAPLAHALAQPLLIILTLTITLILILTIIPALSTTLAPTDVVDGNELVWKYELTRHESISTCSDAAYLTEQMCDSQREATLRQPDVAAADRPAEQGLEFAGRSQRPSTIAEYHASRSNSDRMTSGEDRAG